MTWEAVYERLFRVVRDLSIIGLGDELRVAGYRLHLHPLDWGDVIASAPMVDAHNAAQHSALGGFPVVPDASLERGDIRLVHTIVC